MERPASIMCCLLLVCGLLVASTVGQAKQPTSIPPKITVNEFKEVAYKPGDRVELRCDASGDPKPTFAWKRNDVDITFNMTDLRKEPGSGTLVIEAPTVAHEGVYQCFARNNFGLAVSAKTHLKAAVMEPFPTATNKPPPVHRPTIGEGLSLTCKPPYNYPTGTINWALTEARQDQQQLLNSQSQDMWVQHSDRVTLDYTGRLHFANIVAEDRQNGYTYVCSVQNKVLRGYVQGEDQFIDPQTPSGAAHAKAPTLAWSADSPTVALLAQPARMKCIFYGFPTPTVTWERIDGSPIKSTAVTRSYGMELAIPDVQYSDAGRYRCKGTNIAGASATADIELIVESMPIFEVKPQDKVMAEDEDVEFECKPSGRPTPTLSWTSDGRPLSSLNNPRMQLSADGTRLSIRGIVKEDVQVFQCNASNSHGYAFENAYLNVQSIPAYITEKPEADKKVAEGQDVTIKCRFEGAPRVTVQWQKVDDPSDPDNRQPVNDPRFVTQSNGDLLIKGARKDDTSTYFCYVFNKNGKDEAACRLQVVEKTQIVVKPQSQTVDAPMDVKFDCLASTDAAYSAQLSYKWLKNGQPIDYQDTRYYEDINTHALHIRQTAGRYSAEYTCHVASDIDSDNATAKLTVRDKPDPPHDLKYIMCGARGATITWSKPADNNSPITNYIVFVNAEKANSETHDKSAFKEVERLKGDVTRVDIELSPWKSYVFRVTAVNALGNSEHSAATLTACKTPPERPFVHPSGVCVESREPTSLTIVWKPMSPDDYNGEDFHYVVHYRPISDAGDSPAEEVSQRVDVQDVDLMVFSVPNQPVFQPYEISVEAANQLGTAAQGAPTKYKGYSGQDVPAVSPADFVLLTIVNATSAQFGWSKVNENDKQLKGFPAFYLIQYWKTKDPANKRKHYVSIDSPGLCSEIDEDGYSRFRRDTSQQIAHVMDLWPASKMSAQVHVMNGGNKMGPGSEPPLEFDTPEGPPGPVSNLRFPEKGSSHVKVEWDPPAEPNGNITGYKVYYKPEDDDEWQELPVPDPSQNSVKIKDLKPGTPYEIKVAAVTEPGVGEEKREQVATRPPGSPDKPYIGNIEHGDSSLNVSFAPTLNPDDPNANPGQDFTVKYRKPGDGEWKEVKPEGDNNWVNITGLVNGDTYEIVVVAANGNGPLTESDPQLVTVGDDKQPSSQVETASAWWLLIILCILLLLLLILIIIFLIYRNRGGKYPVYEKEKLRGRDFNDEEGGFGEYSKPDEPDARRTPPPVLDEEERPLESDTDSMAEYDQMDPSKFNEDGSFIGQYGGRKKDQDNGALSTFV